MRWFTFAVCIVALLAPNAVGKNIVLGTDYFSTAFGTKVDFGSPIGIVYFEGGPPCSGPAGTTVDTVVERQADAIVSPGGTAAPIPIQITCLSLKSISPVLVGGTLSNVFVTLDPAHPHDNTGTMTISEDTNVIFGTFASSLTVHFQANFVPVSGRGRGFPVFGHQTFTNPGSPWARAHEPGTCLVTGPVGNQAANCHTGLGPNQQDFFPLKVFDEAQLTNSHRVHVSKTELDRGNVAMGTDYYATQSGTHINFGAGIGDVPLTGLPIVGTADTIIQRLRDAIGSPGGPPAPVPIQLVGLSLKSISPVLTRGNLYNVFVKLDPANLALDRGRMYISENAGSTDGTFLFFLTEYYEADFVPVSSGTAFSVSDKLTFRTSGTIMWSSVAPGGIMIVPGPDDGSSADEVANRHSGLGPNEVDFFPVGVFDECATGAGGCTRASAEHKLGLAP